MKTVLVFLIFGVLLISGCVGDNSAINFLTNAHDDSNGTPSEASDLQTDSTSGTSSDTSVDTSSQTLNCTLLENINSDAYSCSSNEDCIIFIDTCCSIFSKAVNKNYETCLSEGNVDILGKPCGDVCPGTGTPRAAICFDNKCTVAFENVTSVYSVSTVTCVNDADCELSLCNCQCQKNGTDKGICAMIMDPNTCLDIGISGCKCSDGTCVTTS